MGSELNNEDHLRKIARFMQYMGISFFIMIIICFLIYPNYDFLGQSISSTGGFYLRNGAINIIPRIAFTITMFVQMIFALGIFIEFCKIKAKSGAFFLFMAIGFLLCQISEC
jgi:magnesium-transporting ATPase (P-type)